jgi:methyltransferase (TIGR00027 family)
MVAAARAFETDLPEPLIEDPYAKVLIAGAGTGVWENLLDDSMATRLEAADPEAAALFEHMRNYQAVRTRFFDNYFVDAVGAGIRQVVILASGLDSRAYRLDWPAGTKVFEIDQPKVLDYKAAALAASGAEPRAQRCAVAVDLRFDWPAELIGAGFDAKQPTAWLAEGLLPYLPAEAQDRLFEQVTELSEAGSRIAVEAIGPQDEDRRAQVRQRFSDAAEKLGIQQALDIGDLMYNDPHRADVAEWLNVHGWLATGRSSQHEMKRLGRFVELDFFDGDDAFPTFVTAVSHVCDSKAEAGHLT